jgi:hypothetical protein
VKNIKSILVLSLVLILSFPAAKTLSAQEKDYSALLGTWDVELTEMGMAMEFVFKMEEGTLTGELVFEMGNGIMEEIAFDGKQFTCTISIDAGGQTMGVDVSATVNGNEMEGTMLSEMGEAEFTGKKRE